MGKILLTVARTRCLTGLGGACKPYTKESLHENLIPGLKKMNLNKWTNWRFLRYKFSQPQIPTGFKGHYMCGGGDHISQNNIVKHVRTGLRL